MCYVELVDRPGELRPAKRVSYQWALARGMVPPPFRAVESLKEAAELSPSTSADLTGKRHWLGRAPEYARGNSRWRRRAGAPAEPVRVHANLLKPVTVKAAEGSA